MWKHGARVIADPAQPGTTRNKAKDLEQNHNHDYNQTPVVVIEFDDTENLSTNGNTDVAGVQHIVRLADLPDFVQGRLPWQ